MHHGITQPERSELTQGRPQLELQVEKNLPKIFRSAPHPDTILNLM